MKYNCLVVDDEPIAQQILENYIAQVETLRLVAKCSNAIEALQTLHQEKIDILFLDIKMPSLSGLDMLKTLSVPPYTILTTAYSEFGAESYEYNISDYLLKPFSFERFLKAINKILTQKNYFIHDPKQEETSEQIDFLFFKADKKIHKLYIKDIVFFEGSGNYVKIHTTDKSPLMILEKLTDLEEKLPKTIFLRVHKSYIVNIAHILMIEGNIVKVHQKEIPVSITYKPALEKLLNKF